MKTTAKPVGVGKPTERPLIFTAESVQGILAGRKTQTRRLVKRQPVAGDRIVWDKYLGRFQVGQLRASENAWRDIECPYGKPGHRLFVRENGWEPSTPSLRGLRDGADTWPKYVYDADGVSEYEIEDFKRWGWKRRPSMFMPRWASRITLELTGVRVERLQDITLADCDAEGVQIPVEKVQDPPVTGLLRVSGPFPPIQYFPRAWGAQKHTIEENTRVWLQAHYASLWDSINHKKAPWSKNPWVWVLSFRDVSKELASRPQNVPRSQAGDQPLPDQPTKKEVE